MSDRQTVTVGGLEYFLDRGDWAPQVIADSAREGPIVFLSDIFKAFLATQTERNQAVDDVRWLLGNVTLLRLPTSDPRAERLDAIRSRYLRSRYREER